MGRDRYILPPYLLLSLIAVFTICKIELKKILYLNNWFKIIALTIISTIVGFQLFFLAFDKKKSSNGITYELNREQYKETDQNNIKESALKPDVYYIILDAYTSNNALIHRFYFNNDEFLEQCKIRGFYIADSSTSNYPFTKLSLASSLNCEYIEGIAQNSANRNDYTKSLDQLITNNRVMNIFKKNGYHLIKIANWWPLNLSGTNSFISQYQLLFIGILQKSILKPYFDYFGGITESRKDINTSFLNLHNAIIETAHPKFVFAHIMCPHPPFVFESNGEKPHLLKILFNWENKSTRYVNQVSYLNKIVLSFVDTILANSKTRPIVLLQGDHGAMFINTSILDTKAVPDSIFLKYQFMIFNAYLVPDQIRKQLYSTISPVNSFRIITNNLFLSQLKLLPDKNYYASHLEPNRHIDVTHIVEKNN